MKNLINVINAFQGVYPDIPASLVKTFLLVAMEEGYGVTHYMERTGLKQSTMSRHLLDLSDKNRRGGEGLKLISRHQDPSNLRQNQYYLTPKGKQLLHTITTILDND